MRPVPPNPLFLRETLEALYVETEEDSVGYEVFAEVIAEAMGASASLVDAALTELVQEGLVQRRPSGKFALTLDGMEEVQRVMWQPRADTAHFSASFSLVQSRAIKVRAPRSELQLPKELRKLFLALTYADGGEADHNSIHFLELIARPTNIMSAAIAASAVLAKGEGHARVLKNFCASLQEQLEAELVGPTLARKKTTVPSVGGGWLVTCGADVHEALAVALAHASPAD